MTINTKPSYFIIILVITGQYLLHPGAVFGWQQILESISPQVGYIRQLKLTEGAQLNRIAGWGGAVTLQFRIHRTIALGLAVAYHDLNIDQDNAIEQWDWAFWQRFYHNYVRDLQNRDQNYAATLTPVQRLYLIPVQLALELRLPNGSFFTPGLSLAGCVYFYQRNLRLHEQWHKYFPELNYTYTYDFDNHATVYQGNVYGIRTGLGGIFKLSKHFGLEVLGKYHHIIQIKGQAGYDRFPLNSFFEIFSGLVFYY